MVCVERFTHLRHPDCIAKAWRLAYLRCTLKEAAKEMGITAPAFEKHFPEQRKEILRQRAGFDSRFNYYYEKDVKLLEQREKAYAPLTSSGVHVWDSAPTTAQNIIPWYFDTGRPILNNQQLKELEYVMGNLHRRNACTRTPAESDMAMIAQIKAVLHSDREKRKSRLHSC